ncbi:hypothetical protein [Bosea sp. Root381]|uniref:hypothetical protein n=1 Tax=Bosea sp. Root381 TaxID=1736524 RepID=UPI000A672D77|nr:hypothetical protein [Bosea sp. Root381]
MGQRAPEFACADCGAVTMYIPQWTDEDAFIECAGCGKPFATIAELRERLEAALQEDEVSPETAEEPSGLCRQEK